MKKVLRHTNTIMLLLYSVLLMAAISFHEPWFDEAQSWLIARDASFHDILFIIPHYEGHPPFWWLILALPAKLGLPYELGLKSINVIISIFAEYLIIFRSPFPKWIRFTLPFSYFLFYQFGVISRPYSLMFAAICLCALAWKKRDGQPLRFVLPLMLLCLTSAYGILIAGGIAIAWTIEIVKAGTLFKNRLRLWSMVFLLALAVALLLTIWPRSDTFATRLYYTEDTTTFWQRLLLFFFCLPSEVTVTSFCSDSIMNVFCPEPAAVLLMTVISIPLWLLMISLAKGKKTLGYLMLPYGLMAIFGSAKYFYMHHIGILLFLFVFSAWISVDHSFATQFDKKRKNILLLPIVLGTVCSLSWTAFAVICDIKSNFSVGKELSEYIIEHDLEKYNWTSLWAEYRDENSILLYEDVHLIDGSVVETNPYLKEPLTDIQAGGKSYLDHRIVPRTLAEEEINALKERGTDFIIGVPIGGDYLERLSIDNDLELLRRLSCDRVWKNKHAYIDVFIVCRKDLKDGLLGDDK